MGRQPTGQTPIRTIRLAEVWDEAKEAAEARGERLASFVERALHAEIDHPSDQGVTVTIAIPDDLRESLKEIADADHRSVNATMVVALTEYVQNRNRRAAIRHMAAEIARIDQPTLDRLAR